MSEAEILPIKEVKRDEWDRWKNRQKHKIEKFISFISNIPFRIRQQFNIIVLDYDAGKKVINLLSYVITGCLIWYAVHNFNTIASYVIIVIMWEHYFPWTIEKIKRKY